MSGNDAKQPVVNLCGGKGKTVGVNGETMCRLTGRKSKGRERAHHATI